MHTALLSAITIKANRQRLEFDPTAHQELKNSITDRGLLHPPVMRREGGELVLVAGERRLKAITELFELGGSFTYSQTLFTAEAGLIPYNDIGELGELEAEECELDENLKRKDLTWQEHAAAVQRLHKLRTAQAENTRAMELAETGESPQTPAHTVAATAKELTGRSDGSYQDSVRKELVVAKHLTNPVIAKAKSADEAFKLLKKEAQREQNVKLAAAVGESFNADSHQLYNVNCLEWMAKQLTISNERFDVILTDPPYGMGADQFGDGGGKMGGIEHRYDDSVEAWRELMTAWTALSFKITKPEAHAYVFCDIDRFHELKSMMQAAGWYVFRTPLIAHKVNSGRVPLPDRGPRRQYEIILYAIKGGKPVTHIYSDVISTQADDNMTHGAQKPVALYQNLLQRSVRPGDKVLDSFCGTGTIFPAAHTYKCYAVGLEQSKESYGMSVKRLQDVKASDTLGLF